MNQLTLHQFLQTSPAPIHFLKNRPLKKLATTHHIEPDLWLPTSRLVTDYDQTSFTIGTPYGNPKVFFGNHRVWAWNGWQQKGQPSNAWWYEISPCTVPSADTEQLLYSFHLVRELMIALINLPQT